MSYSVEFKNVAKKYKMYNSPSEQLLGLLFPKSYGKDFYALQNISFRAEQGDVVGIVGVNGSGKSTLSNLVAGIVPETEGHIDIKGQSSIIAISAGLDNRLTGRDNIVLKCLMLGYNKREINQLMPGIIEFAEIGDFIDQPVKKYSSGMRSRLGFAISVNINPDILVIDEALSVGDQTFADKCLAKMNEFKSQGKTIFFVSHSMTQMKRFCEKMLWLEAGEIRAYGTVEEILPQYQSFLKEFKAMTKEEQRNFRQHVLQQRSKVNKKSIETIKVMETNEEKKHLKRNYKKISLLISMIILFTFPSMYILKKQFVESGPKNLVDIVEDGKIEPIKKPAIIYSRVTNSYSDVDLKKNLSTLSFGTPIYVQEKINQVYKILYQNQEMYVEANEIVFEDEEGEQSDYSLLDLYSSFPSEFQSSYEFFLVQLGAEYNEVKEKLNGLTDVVDKNGINYLKYESYNVTLVTEEKKKIDAIILESTKINDEDFLELRNEAYQKSKDGSIIKILLDDYDVQVDIEEQIIEIRLKG